MLWYATLEGPKTKDKEGTKGRNAQGNRGPKDRGTKGLGPRDQEGPGPGDQGTRQPRDQARGPADYIDNVFFVLVIPMPYALQQDLIVNGKATYLLVTRASLLVAPGITTSSKDATSSKVPYH